MVKRLLDIVLVIDIEATCWEDEPHEGEENEIIEIGLCPLDLASGERLEKRSILVRPERSRVSKFCTKLTTLTQEQVDQGVSFAEACMILQNEYASRERVWASFGNYDHVMFEEQCQKRQIPYPFGTRHINVKTLFAMAQGLSREMGLAGALRTLNFPLEGTHHRGHDDAWNIARILAEILLRYRRPVQPETD